MFISNEMNGNQKKHKKGAYLAGYHYTYELINSVWGQFQLKVIGGGGGEKINRGVGGGTFERETA